jgi:heat-inducible transcriptional repressor
MLDDRKAAVLRAVVEEYISTAQPVGSAHLAGRPGMVVSSATVRSELSHLEREGYLAQPHTSAGRIPTEKGYRFFVDHLTPPGALDSVHRLRVRDFFAHAHGAIEQMLQDTSRLLADLTDCAAVVIGPSAEVATIRSCQLVDLGRAALLVLVLSNGTVEKYPLELPGGATDGRLAAAGTHLATHLTGLSLQEAAARPRVPSTGDPETDELVKRAGAALRGGHGGDADQVYVGGAARMVTAFDAVDTVRRILSVLEQQFLVVTLLRDVMDRGLSVAIGTELGVEPLAECAVVVAPYRVEGEQGGTIGLLGPTRMNYAQALAAVAVVGKRLGQHLGDG